MEIKMNVEIDLSDRVIEILTNFETVKRQPKKKAIKEQLKEKAIKKEVKKEKPKKKKNKNEQKIEYTKEQVSSTLRNYIMVSDGDLQDERREDVRKELYRHNAISVSELDPIYYAYFIKVFGGDDE